MEQKKKLVTVLVPAYNEQESLPLLYTELSGLMQSLNQYNWQLLFVDDGSTDDTLNEIKQLYLQDKRVNFISLSRNFGKENAMLAGFDHTMGDCCIIMDADLQHPTSLVPDMLKEWENGYQDVYAKRNSRGKESAIRRGLSIFYYRILAKISNIEILQNVGDFRLLDRLCIDALCQMRESQRYTKGLYSWVGYRKKEIVYEQRDRTQGQSSWNFLKLTDLALDGITSFSIVPLRIASVLGLLSSFAAIVYMLYFFIKTLIFGDAVQGFPTLIVVILFLGGMQLFSLGIIGEYLGRIFNESKHRPVYLIAEKGLENQADKDSDAGC